MYDMNVSSMFPHSIYFYNPKSYNKMIHFVSTGDNLENI